MDLITLANDVACGACGALALWLWQLARAKWSKRRPSAVFDPTSREMALEKIKTYREAARKTFREAMQDAAHGYNHMAAQGEAKAKWFADEAKRIEASLPSANEDDARAGRLSVIDGGK